METKYQLNLSGNYSKDLIKTAVINSLASEYLIDELHRQIMQFGKDIDVTSAYDVFEQAKNQSMNVSFSSMEEWVKSKTVAYAQLLVGVKVLDDVVSQSGKKEKGEILDSFSAALTDFVLKLSLVEFGDIYIDFANLEIKKEFIESTIEQIRLVDENEFLVTISAMQLTMTPLTVDKYKNVFIEEKLDRANLILSEIDNEFETSIDKMHDQLNKTYKKFCSIINDSLTDEEKEDKAKTAIKKYDSYIKIVDDLEDKFTEVNELRRQLTIHEKRLKDGLKVQLDGFDKRIKENPNEKEAFELERDSVKFVTEDYFAKIEKLNKEAVDVQNKITNHRKVLDYLIEVLKTAVPSEKELSKYTKLGFKFQEILVRLELGKSQINKKENKEFVDAIDTAVTGLGVLVNVTTEVKDIFSRNSVVVAIFGSVNVMYDIVENNNDMIELSQSKFVTSKLAEYSEISSLFARDLLQFRKICNNVIRDVAIMMSKPFNLSGLLEIIDLVDVAIKQLEHLNRSLDKNHRDQTQLLEDILKV